MGHPDFDAGSGVLETDQPPSVGLLDGLRIGYPPQRGQFDGLADGKRVDDGADLAGQGSDAGLDQFHESVRHDRIAGPPPVSGCLVEVTVDDFLLDDVTQVQDVATGQLPQPTGRFRIQRSDQSG